MTPNKNIDTLNFPYNLPPLSDFLKQKLREQHLSINKASELIEISSDSLYKVIRNKTQILYSANAKKIAAYFNISVEEVTQMREIEIKLQDNEDHVDLLNGLKDGHQHDFVEILQFIRKQNSLSLIEAAYKATIDGGVWKRWEKNHTNIQYIPTYQIKKISFAFNINYVDIYKIAGVYSENAKDHLLPIKFKNLTLFEDVLDISQIYPISTISYAPVPVSKLKSGHNFVLLYKKKDMSPTIKIKDKLLIHLQKNYSEGDIVLVKVPKFESVIIRKAKRDAKKNEMYFVPDDLKHFSLVNPRRTKIEVIGKVISKV